MHRDPNLLRRAARGDEIAFAALWRRHRDAVYAFAAWMLGDRAAAEDVAQETFLAMLERPARFDAGLGSLRTFLLAIARNLCRKRLRKLGPEEDLDFEGAAAEGDALAELIAAESGEALRTAIAQLPVVQREALFLFAFEELSLAEIAAIAEVDPNTVKQRLWRARQRLRRDLSWMKS